MNKKSKVKIGLALGGGSAKGMSYIGLIRVFEKHKISISYVSGTSIGALIGGLYCAGFSADEMEKMINELKWKRMLDFNDFGNGLIRGNKIEKWLRKVLKGKQFKDLKIPFAASAVDIHNGEEVIFDSGDVAKAIHASIAIPGVFSPVKINHRHYVDGGVVDPVPVGILRKKRMDKVIAVSLSTPAKRLRTKKVPENKKSPFMQVFLESGVENLRNYLKQEHILPGSILWFLTPGRIEKFSTKNFPPVFRVVLRSYHLMFNELAILRMAEHKPDIIIKPKVYDIELFDFHKFKKCIKRGESATSRMIGEIEKLVK